MTLATSCLLFCQGSSLFVSLLLPSWVTPLAEADRLASDYVKITTPPPEDGLFSDFDECNTANERMR